MQTHTALGKQETMLTTVCKDILAAWRQAHGTSDGNAHAMVGPEGIVVFIEEAFCKAELRLAAQQQGEQLLNRYIHSLLTEMCREQVQQVETAVQRQVISTGVSTDLEAGWVMCVFKLAEQQQPVYV